MRGRYLSPEEIQKLNQLQFTPLIDCVFLLLLFFMVGLKFKQLDRRLDADLPRAGKPPDVSEPTVIDEIWVRIDDQNSGRGGAPSPRITIDQVVMRDWNHAFSTLSRLAQTGKSKADPVILDPTDNALHGWVLTIMDYLRQLGYTNINFRQ